MDNLIKPFFYALFDPMDEMEVRYLPPQRKTNQVLYRGVAQLIENIPRILQRNQSQDVYFGVNPRTGKVGGAEVIGECRCLVADFDPAGETKPDAAVWTAQEQGLPTPTAIVDSGHGVHLYWRLTEPLSPAAWTAAQVALNRLLGSDPTIKDPPRIMRMPGTGHVKKRGGARCGVRHVEDSRYDIDLIIEDWYDRAEPSESTPDIEPLPAGERAAIPGWVSRVIEYGAASGERNAKLFSAACSLAGANVPRARAADMIQLAASRCEPPMDAAEADAITASAYGKQRTPALLHSDDIPDSIVFVRGTGGSVSSAPAPTAENQKGVQVIQIGEPIKSRGIGKPMLISNVVEDKSPEGGTSAVALSAEEVTASLATATGGWPRRAAGRLFSPGVEGEDGLPTAEAIRYLDRPEALFGWMHDRGELYWAGGACVDPMDGTSRTPMTKNEMFRHLIETRTPHYESAELLPHEPPAERTWYAPHVLERHDSSILYDLVEDWNGETDDDRSLMIAAILTLFWGGGCGKRPAFVFRSRHGAGSGKSTLARLISRIAGGAVESEQISKDAWPRFFQKLITAPGIYQRVALIDNVKHKLDSSEIEAAITSEQLTGHLMYVGPAYRPNRMTWMITSNSPSMSHDLAERSAVIEIGSQRADATFEARVERFIADNRGKLIAAAIEMLSAPPVGEIQPHNLDRWAAWQTAILTRFERADELASLLRARRVGLDADQEDAADLTAIFRAMIRWRGLDPDTARVFIGNNAVASLLRTLDPEDFGARGKRAITTYIKNRLGAGHLRQMRYVVSNAGRGFCWTGDEAAGDVYDDHIADLPNAPDMEKLRPYMVEDQEAVYGTAEISDDKPGDDGIPF